MKTFRNALGGTLGFIAAIISITPQLLKDVGKFMDGFYTYIPSWGWAIISAFIFIALWVWNKVEENQDSKKLPAQTSSHTKQSHSGGGDNVAGDKIVYGEDKKKDNKQEIVFHRTYNHQEFFILKATSEQVLNYIRHDMSSSLWCFDTADNLAYDVSYSDSKFYYPDKDNVAVHGAFLHGIKYELEKRNDEIKNRKNGIHIPDLFWISIASVGIGENVRLQVNFETQDKEAVEFVNVMKKRLVNMFKITDGIAGTWVRSVR